MERLTVHFRFRRGQAVTWTGRPTWRYVVVQQRYTRRDVLSPVYEYLITSDDGTDTFWTYETDLEPAEGKP